MIKKDFTLDNGAVINEWQVRSQTTDFKKGLVVFVLEGYISGASEPVLTKSVLINDGKGAEWAEAALLGMTKAQLLAFCEGVVSQMDLTKQGLPCFKVEA